MLLVDTQKESKINNIVILLHSENPNYNPIPVDNTTEIVEVVVSVQSDMV